MLRASTAGNACRFNAETCLGIVGYSLLPEGGILVSRTDGNVSPAS